MTTLPVRTRFAPSPTGSPHIGNMRTALYNWLLARHTKGQFILRIEDTDQERININAIQQITESLKWLGLDWDEGPDVGGMFEPYIQSQRKSFYSQAAATMVSKGYAYLCDCDQDRLSRIRQIQISNKQAPGYDGKCRTRPREEIEKSLKQGLPVVVRCKVPYTGNIAFKDRVYGTINFDLSKISDFVILKSDGMPTYHLAHVLDDHLMKITHVIRGEEWISSVPRHLLIQRGLEINSPLYAHVPLMLAKDKTKMSKRHGTSAISDYISKGFLPHAIVNYMALLGWSDGTNQELFSKEELIGNFNLSGIQSHPSIFNLDKLNWMNAIYIRQMDSEKLSNSLLPYLEREHSQGGLPDSVQRPINTDMLSRVVPLIKERIQRLEQASDAVDIFFDNIPLPNFATLTAKGPNVSSVIEFLKIALDICDSLEKFEAQYLEGFFRKTAKDKGFNTGKFFYPIRVAITSRTVAPPIFDTMAVLGRATTTKRIKRAITALEESTTTI